ncbi:MAG: hypothetical protein ACREBK_07900 [Sphingomicrobium sp.]
MSRRAFSVAIALAFAASAGTQSAAAAQGNGAAPQAAVGGVSDPVRFVLAAYRLDAASPDKPGPIGMLDEDKPEYTPRLRALFAIQQREHGKDEVGRLDMDIFTGSQDGEVSDVAVEARDVDFAEPPRKVVIARFKLERQPREFFFYFEKLGGRWFLDDIATPGDGTKEGMPPWTLSTVLKYGWQD